MPTPRSLATRFGRAGLSLRETIRWRTPVAAASRPGLRSLMASRRVLTLDRVTCHETEDITGRDEVRVEVWLDGQFDDALRFRLNDGRHKNLDARYEFNSRARVVLYDEDTSRPSDIVRLDRDDLLGDQTFSEPERTSRRFDRDGASYTLDARVEIGDPGPATDAYDLLDDFAASTAAGRWPQLGKADIVQQVEARLRQPWIVDQGPTSNCGPAAVVVELARRSPRRYVRLVRSLFEEGDFRLKNGDRITTSPDLRSAPVRARSPDSNRGPLPDVDWMVLASLRESANLVYEGEDSFDNMGSTHWEVAGWLWALCGYNHVDYFPGVPRMASNVFTPWDVPPQKWLDEAIEVLSKGGSVIASLDTSILGNRIPDWWSLPTHLVVLLDSRHTRFPGIGAQPGGMGPLEVDRSFVRWTIASWGRLIREVTRDDDFETGMWILVTGH